MSVMEIKRLVVPFSEVKADGDANSEMGCFCGYGSTFGNIDLGGDIVKAGAFSKSLAEWSKNGEMPSMFGFHDFNNPIGDWLEMREDEKGLWVKGRMWVYGDRRIEEAVKCYNMLRGTGKKGLSIGYRVTDYETQEFDGGIVRVLKEIDLMEVSVAGWAMNPQATVTNVKSLKDSDGNIRSKREFERLLRDADLSSREAKAFIAGGYDAIERDAKGTGKAADRDDQLDMSAILASLQSPLKKLKGENHE